MKEGSPVVTYSIVYRFMKQGIQNIKRVALDSTRANESLGLKFLCTVNAAIQ